MMLSFNEQRYDVIRDSEWIKNNFFRTIYQPWNAYKINQNAKDTFPGIKSTNLNVYFWDRECLIVYILSAPRVSNLPLPSIGWFITRLLTTSAGVPIVAPINAEQKLQTDAILILVLRIRLKILTEERQNILFIRFTHLIRVREASA